MSILDSIKKFASPYSDDDYDDYDEEEYEDEYEEEPAPRRRAPRRPAPAPAPQVEEEPDYGYGPVTTTTTPVPPSLSTAPSAGGFGSSVLNMPTPAPTPTKQEVVLFRPNNFGDITKAAEDLMSRKAVVVNMEGVDKAMARRVVDFLSGSVFALQGSVTKIAQSAYLFCPQNMSVMGDLESLQAEVESYI